MLTVTTFFLCSIRKFMQERKVVAFERRPFTGRTEVFCLLTALPLHPANFPGESLLVAAKYRGIEEGGWLVRSHIGFNALLYLLVCTQ